MKFQELDFDVQKRVVDQCYSDLWESGMPVTEEYVQYRVRQLEYSENGRIVTENITIPTFADWLSDYYEMTEEQLNEETYDFQRNVYKNYELFISRFK